jgi:hypothetical protein
MDDDSPAGRSPLVARITCVDRVARTLLCVRCALRYQPPPRMGSLLCPTWHPHHDEHAACGWIHRVWQCERDRVFRSILVPPLDRRSITHNACATRAGNHHALAWAYRNGASTGRVLRSVRLATGATRIGARVILGLGVREAGSGLSVVGPHQTYMQPQTRAAVGQSCRGAMAVPVWRAQPLVCIRRGSCRERAAAVRGRCLRQRVVAKGWPNPFAEQKVRHLLLQ